MVIALGIAKSLCSSSLWCLTVSDAGRTQYAFRKHHLSHITNTHGPTPLTRLARLQLDDGAPAAGSSMTPGSIGSAVPKKAAAIAKPSKEIWDVDEVVEDGKLSSFHMFEWILRLLT